MKAAILNGKLYQGDACDRLTISAADRGFLLGDGLFETLPVLNGHPLWWPEHRQRLNESAQLLDLPVNEEVLEDGISQLCTLSFQAEPSNAILRIALSRGAGGRGLLPPASPSPTLLATLTPLPQNLAFEDMKLASCGIRRNEYSITARIKSSNYLDNIQAAREAEAAGADDALLRNTYGSIASTSIGNIFALFGKCLITPPLADGVLAGVMRGQLLSLAPQWGFEVVEASLAPEDAKKADGLFMTNSLRFIRRVTALDGHAFPSATNDPIAQLQSALRAHIAKLTGAAL
nr:aminotransferase class IV [uncultured Cohaesibacter sp.]